MIHEVEEQQFSEKFARDRFRQWHFWWLVVFSFLLIMTFVWYLPTRFLYQFSAGESHGHAEEETEGHAHEDGETTDMHEHMDEHMGEEMDMDEMMEHMMEEHGMMHEGANEMMEEMMSHEHEEGSDGHEHEETATDQGDNHGGVIYSEETGVKEGLAVNLNISPVPYNTGTPLNLDFFVNMKPGNVPVLANQLEVEHEKLMHVVGLRSDMNEYFHIHPEFLADNPSVFSIDHIFSKPGLYKIWSSIMKDGTVQVFAHPEVNVNGAGPREEKNVSFDRNVVAGNYQVSLISSDTIVQNREVELSFDMHTLNGQEINVENYLGAQMHLVLIKDDWGQFIHTHPGGSAHGHSYNADFIEVARADEGHDHTTTETSEQTAGDEVISFSVSFPEPGLYKAFAQFRPEGIDLPADEAILAEFWIQVEEKAPFPVSQWWGLLLASALLMAGLSWWVNRYLKVKPEDVTVKK